MEDVSLFRVLAAFVFVIALILIFSWMLKHLRGSRWVEKVQGQRRLQLVEQLYLDAKHKVVLVKCDETEHLLLVGDGQPVTSISKDKKK